MKRLYLSIVILLICSQAFADMFNFRFWSTADGLGGNNTYHVTKSPTGKMWFTHDGDYYSWYDGYEIGTIPATGEGYYPIFEFENGGIWTGYPHGLMELKDGNWVKHQIIKPKYSPRSKFITSYIPWANFRYIMASSIIQYTSKSILILRPKDLSKFNIHTNEIVTLKESKEANISSFKMFNKMSNGNILIQGWCATKPNIGVFYAINGEIQKDSHWSEISVQGCPQIPPIEGM